MPESTKPPRHFPPPWSIKDYNDACFIVRDANQQVLAFVYCKDEPGRRTTAKLLTRDEAHFGPKLPSLALILASCKSL